MRFYRFITNGTRFWRSNGKLRCMSPLVNARTGLLAACCLVPTVSAWGFTSNKMSSITAEKDPDFQIIEEADRIYAEGNVQHLLDYLIRFKNSNNADILWRLCRALRNKAEVEANKDERKRLVYEAYDLIKKALSIDDNNFAVHKWYAILINKTGEYEGTKAQLSNSYKVKEHFMKAKELNPNDATSIHLLGLWCFTFADLPWYQRKIASAIFATPPSSSYEEALQCFLEAEKVDPGFYSMNLMMIGKTYLRLNQKEKAAEYLSKSRDHTIKNVDDQQAHDEAVQLLKGL